MGREKRFGKNKDRLYEVKLDFCTPRYIVYKETDCRKMKVDWGKRAVNFELKINKLGEDRLAKQCWIEKLEEGEKDRYSKQRGGFYNSLGWSTLEIENRKWLGKEIQKVVEERVLDIENQILEGKIRESRYNDKYKVIKSKGLSNYLKGWKVESQMEALARFRCGNFEEKNRY